MMKFKYCKKLLFLFIVLAIWTHLTNQLFATMPDFAWAKRAGGTGIDMPQAIATDGAGNSIIVGFFSGSISFGMTRLLSSGQEDIFIAKYDPSGNLLWAKRAGGTGADYALAVAVDKNDQILVTGWFNNTAQFGTVTLTSAGLNDLFVVKYNTDGSLIWARKAGGVDAESGKGIAVDAASNVYVTGFFRGSSTFGSTTLTSAGESDIFIAKYDQSGDLKYARRAGGSGNDSGEGIAVDSDGYCYITGDFSGTAKFTGIMMISFTLESQGAYDIFTARYNCESGFAVWAKSVGGSNAEWGPCLAIDRQGYFTLVFNFSGSIKIDPYVYISAGKQDIFMVRYDKNGTIQWAKREGGSGDEVVYGIATDNLNNFIIAGQFDTTLKLGTVTLNPLSGDEVFIASFDNTGNAIWVEAAKGINDDAAYGIAIDQAGNRFLTGMVQEKLAFGSVTLNSVGSSDVFIAKMNNVNPPVLMITDVWWGNEVDQDGDGYVQSAMLYWKAKVVQGDIPNAIYDKISWKQYRTFIYTAGSSLLSSFSQNNTRSSWIRSENIGINSGQKSMDFMIGMGFDFMGTQLPYYEFDPERFPVLSNYKMESVADDGGSTGFTVSGKVAYFSNSKPVKNVTLKLNETTINSGNEGSFSFNNLTNGNYTLLPTKTGDINAAIGAYDASMILRYSVGLVTLTPQQLLAGDVSANGSVAAFDASYILRYTVGLITSFPVNAEWRFVPASFSLTNSNWNSAPDKINYSPLNSNQSNQNFAALVYGDVSGNWSPAGLAKTSMGQATVSFGKLQSKDERITLPVQADIRGELCAAELIFSVDAEKIKVQDVRLGEKLDGYHLAWSQENGKLRIALAGAEPVHAQDLELIDLNFEVKDPTSNTPINLELSEVVLNEGQISTEISNRFLAIGATIPTTHRLFQNSPNPFNPTTSMEYHLAENADVTLTIFDLTGKEVKKYQNNSQSAGRYRIQWNGSDEFSRPVASGVYFYRLEVLPKLSASRPFTAIRRMILMK